MIQNKRAFRRRVSVFFSFVALLAVAWWTYGDALDWDWILQRERWLHAAVEEHPFVSPFIGFVAYIALSLVPGITGKAIACGWLFGFWIGLLISSTALTIAAVMSCAVVRYLLRDIAESKFSRLAHFIDRSVSRDGAMWLVTLRLLHAPYTLTNYASGATAIPLTTFAWTTQLGILPGTIVFVLAGSRIPSLQAIAEQGIWHAVNLPLLALLSLLAFLPFLRRIVRWLLPRLIRQNRSTKMRNLEHDSRA